MLTTAEFFQLTQWAGITTLVVAVLAIAGFIFKWGVRFQLVGVTGFMAVLTGGLFALSLVPIVRTVVPGAVRYSVVYDNGATQAVISIPPTITETELEATLQQAANDLYSYGRLGREQDQLNIRARTVIHPKPGVSQPLYLGDVRRSLRNREDEQIQIEIFSDKFAKLPKSSA
ncbi:Ycf51 family protein [Gloeocapsa sp. BRSZ]